jgi:Fe-S-cluster containining protein
MKKLTSEDCRKCGLCCVAPYEQDSFCDVTEKDQKRLGRRFVRLHVIQFNSWDRLLSVFDGKRMPPGAIRTKERLVRAGPLQGATAYACAMLRGTLMQRVSCSIYEKRPEVCRKAVKPGDRICRAIRRDFRKELEESSS